MRSLFLFFCLVVSLHALKIDISYGKEQGKPFSIITLTHNSPFKCKSILREEWRSSFVQCIIDSIPENGFLPFDTNFFDVSYQMIDKKFHLIIKEKDKYKQQLFYIPDDIQESGFFLGVEEGLSKTWQIVGYDKEIPFLSENKNRGINFPIEFAENKYHYIGEIDTDKKPVITSLGADYLEYLKVKDFIESNSYGPALNAIAATFKKFPNTLFAKDLLFFQIKALYHLKRYDSVIDYGDNWINHYASDSSVPEVLFILGKTYMHLKFPSEAMYYYRRIIDEYPEDRFASLSKMKIASQLAQGTNTGLARIYFSQAYQETKNTNDAIEIAIEWAIFEIQNNHIQNAEELFDKVIKTHPEYFAKEQDKSVRLLAFLSEKQMYKIAALIGQKFVDHINKEESSYEKILFLLGKFYEKSQQFDDAHKVNSQYLKEYDGYPGAKEVLSRDDKLLFKVSGSDKEKIERYDYILQKYANTPEALKAATLKAEILINEHKYEEVLNMKKVLPKDNELYNEALALLINQNIKEGHCSLISQYLAEIEDFKYIENKLQAFDCLYALHFNSKAEKLVKKEMENKESSFYLDWLYRDAKNLYKLGKYQNSILASKDVLSLAEAKKKPQYGDILFTMFDALNRLNSPDTIKIYGELEKQFGDDKRMLKVYVALLEKKTNVNTAKLVYAQKLYELQEKHKIKDYTPFVEFIWIDALKENNDFQKAYGIVTKLVDENLGDSEKQKAFYLKADLELKLGEKVSAANSLQQCTDIVTESSWKTLCEKSKDLLKE
ncbi:tetratricopeptide repeat protein [Helicobacter anatolicus]|uniref:tetratricopeptide repeat protein n=1 Tax=Helicobacter anatolicus TaxID=2905874 RepID=UPI001E2F00F0|nr:outer membrane protein assembly factor BamD [Helicobacter anatolicus]MCE3040518.1 hypothetical protein [Helicobacter anatolicus]